MSRLQSLILVSHDESKGVSHFLVPCSLKNGSAGSIRTLTVSTVVIHLPGGPMKTQRKVKSPLKTIVFTFRIKNGLPSFNDNEYKS